MDVCIYDAIVITVFYVNIVYGLKKHFHVIAIDLKFLRCPVLSPTHYAVSTLV